MRRTGITLMQCGSVLPMLCLFVAFGWSDPKGTFERAFTQTWFELMTLMGIPMFLVGYLLWVVARRRASHRDAKLHVH
jgi:hypothetical protein